MEMHDSLSTDTCAVKTLAWHHTSAKHHHSAYLIEMPQTLLIDTCAAKTFTWHHTNAKLPIGVGRDFG